MRINAERVTDSYHKVINEIEYEVKVLNSEEVRIALTDKRDILGSSILIPEKIDGRKVVEVWYCKANKIASLTLPCTVRKVEDYTFDDCRRMENIYVDEGNRCIL